MRLNRRALATTQDTRNGQIQKASKSKSKKVILWGMVLRTYNPYPREAETGASNGFPGQPV